MASIGDVVARNVRVERVRRRWRQADLAEHLGWSMTKVSDIEAGKRRVSADQLVELCAAFKIPLVRLLDEADPEDLHTLGLGQAP
jgi:transcriptional regulator with XRE-family HTH domain